MDISVLSPSVLESHRHRPSSLWIRPAGVTFPPPFSPLLCAVWAPVWESAGSWDQLRAQSLTLAFRGLFFRVVFIRVESPLYWHVAACFRWSFSCRAATLMCMVPPAVGLVEFPCFLDSLFADGYFRVDASTLPSVVGPGCIPPTPLATSCCESWFSPLLGLIWGSFAVLSRRSTLPLV